MTVSEVPQLRPLGLGQLLDRAIRLYRRNFVTFTGIIASVYVPITVFQLLLTIINIPRTIEALERLSSPSAQPTSWGSLVDLWSTGAGGVTSFLTIVLTLVLVNGAATAALVRAVSDSYLGESVSIFGSFRKIGRRWLKLIGALLLAGLINLGLILYWVAVPCLGWITGLGIILYFSWVIQALIAPILVLEDQSAGGAIRRAWDLSRRRFWWALGFMFILIIFSQIVVTAPATLASVVLNAVLGSWASARDPASVLTIRTVVQSLVSLALNLIYLPLQLTATILLYFDLRIRTEGFDLGVLSASIEASGTELGELTTQAPPPVRGRLITGTELAYFAGLSVGVVILFGILWGLMVGLITLGTVATYGGGP
jgi:hypothetical protein